MTSLGPGTLILANGNIVPILPKSTSILPQNRAIINNPPPIVVNPPANNTTLIVVATSAPGTIVNTAITTTANTAVVTSTSVSPKTAKTLPQIRPKRCVTKTIHMNKVPIPALSSSYASAQLAVSNPSKPPSVQKVVRNKSVQQYRQKPKENAKKADSNISNRSVTKSTVVAVENESATKNSSKGKQGNAEKRKADLPVLNEPEVKRSKIDETAKESAADVQPMQSASNIPEIKDDPKNTSNYSIDSLCKEKEVHDKKTEKESDEKSHNDESKGLIKKTETLQQQQNTNNEHLNENTITKLPETSGVPSTSTNQEVVKSPGIPESVLKEIENHENGEKPEEPTVDKNNTKALELNLTHSELSNDIFASLQVPTGGQNPESTSPTAAFLLAFPLVSSLTGVKVTEVMEDENSDSQHGTPTLLQIGTMDSTKPTQSNSESLTPSLLNLDNFSFFSSKDICNSFYPVFDNFVASTTSTNCAISTVTSTITSAITSTITSAVTDVLTSAITSTVTTSINNTIKVTETAKNGYASQQIRDKGMKGTYDISFKTKTTEFAPVAPVCYTTSITANKPSSSAPKTISTVVQSNHTTATTVANKQERNEELKSRNVPQATTQLVPFSYNNPLNVYESYTPNLYQNASQNINTNPTQNIFANKAKQFDTQKNISLSKSSATISYSSTTIKPTYTMAQCNTFNPFTDISKSVVMPNYNVSKPYTEPLYTNSTSYSYNYQPENSFCQNSTMYNTNNKNSSKVDNKSYYNVNYDNSYVDYKVGDNRKYETTNFSNSYCQVQNSQTQNNKDKFNTVPSKGKNANTQPRAPVNWMMTPDLRQQNQNADYSLPSFTKDIDSVYPTNSFVSNAQTSYFNTNTSVYSQEKTLDTTFPVVHPNTYQRNDMEDNNFSWSPTKLPQLLDSQHSFVSSTLPTLVGDLALGNTSTPFGDTAKVDTSKNARPKDNRRNKTQNYDNQANFFSVSQLVEHNKNDVAPARVTSRRNSGNRSSKSNVSQKSSTKRGHKEAVKDNHGYTNTPHPNKMVDSTVPKNQMKQTQQSHNPIYNQNQDWLGDGSKSSKHPSSSYSAEALISHQPMMENTMHKQRNNSNQQQNYPSTTKSLPVPFLADNLLPYFPSMDLQQESSFPQQNQNYQNTGFPPNFSTSIQSNTYSTNSLIGNIPAITTNYLPVTNFMPDLGTTHDYNPVISENLNLFSHTSRASDVKAYNKNPAGKSATLPFGNRTEDKKNSASIATTSASCSISSANAFLKKAKKKTTSDNSVPGFVDFSFLSMPGAINSPILPDDFHTNFLPPHTPQLYPCKNPLYPKQNNDLNSSSLLPLPPVPVSRSNIQHPEISPSVNSMGTSLTNFNLSTIFPEINKVSFFFLSKIEDNKDDV